jgi:hypothetical protein
MGYIKVLSLHLLEGNEEKDKKSQPDSRFPGRVLKSRPP